DLLLFLSAGAPRVPHSFPTRRSSDLADTRATGASWAAVAWVGRSRRAARVTCGCLPGVRQGRRRAATTPRTTMVGYAARGRGHRSEEHTSELQSPYDLVCRLLLEKKK